MNCMIDALFTGSITAMVSIAVACLIVVIIAGITVAINPSKEASMKSLVSAVATPFVASAVSGMGIGLLALVYYY